MSAKLEGLNEANAQDVASQVLLDIFSHAAGYKEIENYKAWMYKVIKYAIINFKKRNVKYIYTELMDNVYSAKDEKPDFKLDFKRFLAGLPPRQREMAELHYVYGFKIKEVAKQLGISVSTVNRDISSLKGELKKFLTNFEKDETFCFHA